jgi:AmmeMemoRadiSam system protein B/AmmeMemoRadiSam system protein A
MSIIIAAALFAGAAATPARTAGTVKAGVRHPAVSGQFYPADPDKLRASIDCFLEDAVDRFDEKPVAIVCPHAGYIFSGQIAADAYSQAAKHSYDLVVIVGVNHTTGGFRGVSVYPSDGYRTPLGVAEIDEELAGRLIEADDDFVFEKRVHEREHSVEVQVPFVQRLFPATPIVTAIVGSPDPRLCEKFGLTLARLVRDRSALLVASCDLSHFPVYGDAVDVDKKTLEAFSTLEPGAVRSAIEKEMRRGVENLSTCACGEASVLAVMTAARELGADGAQILSYANSGDTVMGDRARVVGYGAVAFVTGAESAEVPALRHSPAADEEEIIIAPHHREALLAFARRTIRQYLDGGTAPLARGFDPALDIEKGAFVTLRKGGDLRGCIGHMNADLPLSQVVGYCALQAAFNDRRFSPLGPDELDEIDIEVSVLTPYKRVDGYGDIEIGRDGVLMMKDDRSAVFLPSVAVEQGWTLEETLAQLSRKAGLPRDAWKDEATFYTFQAIVFGESETH